MPYFDLLLHTSPDASFRHLQIISHLLSFPPYKLFRSLYSAYPTTTLSTFDPQKGGLCVYVVFCWEQEIYMYRMCRQICRPIQPQLNRTRIQASKQAVRYGGLWPIQPYFPSNASIAIRVRVRIRVSLQKVSYFLWNMLVSTIPVFKPPLIKQLTACEPSLYLNNLLQDVTR